MNKKKKVVISCILILFNVALIAGYLVIRDATSLNHLNKEVEELAKLDITTDRYNRKIKSNGGYAIVERCIKNYFDDFAIGIDEVTEIASEERFRNILSYENYQNDGPEFTESLAYIAEKKSEFNRKIDYLIDRIETQYIEEYIQDRTSSKYYVSLYNGIMSDNRLVGKLHQLKDLLKTTKVRINNIYDTSSDVLNFLKVYKDDWELEDGEIKFKTDELYKNYMGMIGKI